MKKDLKSILEGQAVTNGYRSDPFEDCPRCEQHQEEIRRLKIALEGQPKRREKWIVHPATNRALGINTTNTCRSCGKNAYLQFVRYCEGVRFLYFWNRCPDRAHLHVQCMECKMSWLEECVKFESHEIDA